MEKQKKGWPVDDTDNVKGLTTDQMTGTGALNNMVFVYGTGETSPWMEKANETCVQYYPHLKGFLYDTTKDPDDWPPSVQNHIWSTDWSKNGNSHWHECTICRRKIEEAGHSWDAGKVTKPATEQAEGVRTYTCTVCKATKTESIPKLKPPVSGTPLSRIKAGKTSITIAWAKVKGAAGYDIFFAKCSSHDKATSCRKVKTIKASKIFKWKKTGLKRSIAYKAYVKAFVMQNGKKKYVGTSPLMHAYTGNGTKKYTNAKSVKLKNVKKGKLSLKKGKTFKIKANVIKINKNKKLMGKGHAPTLRYLTSNKKVATVSKSGKVTAKGKGTCYIYVYAHNGVSKQVRITVK